MIRVEKETYWGRRVEMAEAGSRPVAPSSRARVVKRFLTGTSSPKLTVLALCCALASALYLPDMAYMLSCFPVLFYQAVFSSGSD